MSIGDGPIWLRLGAEVRRGIALEPSRVLREIGYLLLRDSNTFFGKWPVAWSCGSSLDYLINMFATTQPPWGLVSFCRATLLYPPATWSLVPYWLPTFDKRNCCPQPWLLHSCARTGRWQRGVPWCWSSSMGIAAWFSELLSPWFCYGNKKTTHPGHDGFFLAETAASIPDAQEHLRKNCLTWNNMDSFLFLLMNMGSIMFNEVCPIASSSWNLSVSKFI